MWYRHCTVCGVPIYMDAKGWRDTIGQSVLCPPCKEDEEEV